MELSHLNKEQAQSLEYDFFQIANTIHNGVFIYTPRVMLLYNGYACQPDGLMGDFSRALEIKSLNRKNFEAFPTDGTLPHRFQRVYYKYFLANPYLEAMAFFVISQEDYAQHFVLSFPRPTGYIFDIKRAHQGTEKIKGDYRIIDFDDDSLSKAMQRLSSFTE